jgi:hypothetical protein
MLSDATPRQQHPGPTHGCGCSTAYGGEACSSKHVSEVQPGTRRVEPYWQRGAAWCDRSTAWGLSKERSCTPWHGCARKPHMHVVEVQQGATPRLQPSRSWRGRPASLQCSSLWKQRCTHHAEEGHARGGGRDAKCVARRAPRWAGAVCSRAPRRGDCQPAHPRGEAGACGTPGEPGGVHGGGDSARPRHDSLGSYRRPRARRSDPTEQARARRGVSEEPCALQPVLSRRERGGGACSPRRSMSRRLQQVDGGVQGYEATVRRRASVPARESATARRDVTPPPALTRDTV